MVVQEEELFMEQMQTMNMQKHSINGMVLQKFFLKIIIGII